jgi:hypothetical protein
MLESPMKSGTFVFRRRRNNANSDLRRVWQEAINFDADYDRLYAACEKQSKMLSGLRRSLLENRR